MLLGKKRVRIPIIMLMVLLVFIGGILFLKGGVIESFFMNQPKSLNKLQVVGFSLLLLASICYAFYLKFFIITNLNWVEPIIIGLSILFFWVRFICIRPDTLGYIDTFIVFFLLISIILLIRLVFLHLVSGLYESFKDFSTSEKATHIIAIFALLISFLNIIL